MIMFEKRDFPNAKERKMMDDISKIRNEIENLERKIELILRGHPHVISRRDLQSTDTSAICIICGENFGWWCPKSPDGFCEYSTTFDSCDWCGEPEERK
jgi:3',5'-cyclic AMP phosphodiesterase CpdA